MDNVLHAADNPELANKIAEQAFSEPKDTTPTTATIRTPSDTMVNLPGGYISATGEVHRTAEVKELTGRDEEAIIRNSQYFKVFSTLLQRGTVSLGPDQPSEYDIDNLLIGDRNALMLGIYKATYGSNANLGAYCNGCKDMKTVEIDIDTDIKTHILVDPVRDRSFTIKGRRNEFLVTLPTGKTEKQITLATEVTAAEALSALLETTILEIDGRPVLTRKQVQDLGVADRHTIAEAIASREVGPVFDDIKVECPDCGGEVRVAVDLASLFRF
jgi:hypothetical protein